MCHLSHKDVIDVQLCDNLGHLSALLDDKISHYREIDVMSKVCSLISMSIIGSLFHLTFSNKSEYREAFQYEEYEQSTLTWGWR